MIIKLHSKALLLLLTRNNLRQGTTCGLETFIKYLEANIKYNK